MNQLNYVISYYFSIIFNALCMCPKIRCNGYCKNFLETKSPLSFFSFAPVQMEARANVPSSRKHDLRVTTP